MSSHLPEQDLLLLAHNQLSPLRRLAAERHLNRCEECRGRLARLTAVSHQIAAALRPAGLPAWKPASSGRVGILPFTPATLVLVAALVLVLASAVVVTAHIRAKDAHARPVGVVFGPCRPDLPNSRCR